MTEFTLRQRFKLAINAFFLRNVEIKLPYYEGGNVHFAACDNSRRKSKCPNYAEAVLFTTQATFNTDNTRDTYMVCRKCANKYVGTVDGEKWS